MRNSKKFIEALFASVLCLSLTGCQEQLSVTENIPGKTQILVSGATRIKTNSTSKRRTVVYGPSASVIWSSEDTSIATVSQDGTVKGLKPGFVTLTATSAYSTEENPISTSYTVLIEPDYLDNMISTILSYPWSTGVQFSSSASISLSSSLSTSISGLTNIKIDNSSESDSSPFLVDSSIKSESLDIDTNVAYLGEDSIYIYGLDEDKSFTAFNKYSFTDIASALLSLNILTTPNFEFNGIDFDSDDFDYTTIAGAEINKYITFSSDINTGITLTPVCLNHINTKIADLKNENDESTSGLSLLASIIPDSITSFSITTSSTYSDCKIRIGGKTGTDEFNFFEGMISKSSAGVSSDYFDNLRASLEAVGPEEDFISDMKKQAGSISDILSERKNDIYDSINFSNNFSSLVSDYNDSYYSIYKSENPALYSDLKQYGPYIYCQVSDEAGNILPDKTFAKTETVYRISEPRVAGSNTAFDISSYRVEIIESIKDKCTYTYDDEAETIIFTSLPSSGSLTISLTPKSSAEASLVPVSFTFRAPR
ncbi:MAG: Ig-like domain-containing protein [Candidatus Cloacimonetes bacterium]|nr:Ig-like domain-containing protein [Candidatus Cloacimonadota bacterium]